MDPPIAWLPRALVPWPWLKCTWSRIAKGFHSKWNHVVSGSGPIFSSSPKLIRWIWICEEQEKWKIWIQFRISVKNSIRFRFSLHQWFQIQFMFIPNMVVIQSQTHFCFRFQLPIRCHFWIRFDLEKDLDPSLWLEFETYKNSGSYNMFWIRSNFLWKSKLSFKPIISDTGE